MQKTLSISNNRIGNESSLCLAMMISATLSYVAAGMIFLDFNWVCISSEAFLSDAETVFSSARI